jgi:hypothetical protein
MSRFTPNRRLPFFACALALWIAGIGFGMSKLWTYSTTPGHPAQPPERWPRAAPIERPPGKFRLLMFAHPQCECTQASIGELAIIMAHSAGRVNAAVLFFEPSKTPIEWIESDLWKTAAAISFVSVARDKDAQIAQTFGVYTSGQTLLYNPDGQLVFTGGITAFRGHSGDNAGRSAITALLQRDIPSNTTLPITTRVFGCSLRGE